MTHPLAQQQVRNRDLMPGERLKYGSDRTRIKGPDFAAAVVAFVGRL